MLKSYAGEKITPIMKKTVVEFISVESRVYHCLLFLNLPLLVSYGVPVWLQFAFSRLHVIHSLWLSPSGFAGPPLFYPAVFPSTVGPGVVHLMTQKDCQCLPHLPPQGASGDGWMGTLGHPGGHYSVFRDTWEECFPIPLPHVLFCPRFFPIIYGFW